MGSSWTKRTLVLVATTGLLVPLGAGLAAAEPSPTPNGWVGACNMVSSWPGLSPGNGVSVQPGGGMERAMTVNNPNGNAGMFNAVFHSGNGAC